MTAPVRMVDIWRGAFAESGHTGHAVICDGSGAIVEAWGDPKSVVLPRSSVKMIQALPLILTGAARAYRLTEQHLALACASHQGAPLHVDAVTDWLAALDLTPDALRCGPQPSRDRGLRRQMQDAGLPPGRVHNNCSGKHAGFLTCARHMQARLDYLESDHPVQRACLEMFEMSTGAPSPGWSIDGCSAPNFASTLEGVARAMAWFASAAQRSDAASSAAARLVAAMRAHPMLVAGEGRACTLLMRAAQEPLALKTGAEGFFTAILPQRGLGVALKITDGATRASECAISAVLVRLGVLDPAHPDVARFLRPDVVNWDGLVTGHIAPAEGFPG